MRYSVAIIGSAKFHFRYVVPLTYFVSVGTETGKDGERARERKRKRERRTDRQRQADERTEND